MKYFLFRAKYRKLDKSFFFCKNLNGLLFSEQICTFASTMAINMQVKYFHREKVFQYRLYYINDLSANVLIQIKLENLKTNK